MDNVQPISVPIAADAKSPTLSLITSNHFNLSLNQVKNFLITSGIKQLNRCKLSVQLLQRLLNYSLRGGYRAFLIGEEGDECSSLLYIGSDRYFDDLFRILSLSSPDVKRLNRVHPLNFSSTLRRLGENVPLVVVERVPFWPSMRHPAELQGAVDRRAVVCNIPAYTDPVLHLKADLSTTVAAIRSSRMRQKVRRVMREGFSTEMGQGLDDLTYFYEQLWKPMAEVQHGKSQRIPPLDEFVRNKRKYLLFFLKKDNERVAGGVFIKPTFNPEAIRFMWLGFRKDILADQNLLNLVNVALYLQAFDLAQTRGYSRVFMGPTPPTLTVGSLWYKISWGSDIDLPAASPILSFCYQSKEHFLRAIADRPVIHCKENGINACIPWPEEQTVNYSNVQSLVKKYWFKSLNGVDIACHQRVHAELGSTVGHIKVVSAHEQATAIDWMEL